MIGNDFNLPAARTAAAGFAAVSAGESWPYAFTGLAPEDSTEAAAALKAYTPGGKYDPYIMFSSGGQGGQVLVIGVPSTNAVV